MPPSQDRCAELGALISAEKYEPGNGPGRVGTSNLEPRAVTARLTIRRELGTTLDPEGGEHDARKEAREEDREEGREEGRQEAGQEDREEGEEVLVRSKT